MKTFSSGYIFRKTLKLKYQKVINLESVPWCFLFHTFSLQLTEYFSLWSIFQFNTIKHLGGACGCQNVWTVLVQTFTVALPQMPLNKTFDTNIEWLCCMSETNICYLMAYPYIFVNYLVFFCELTTHGSWGSPPPSGFLFLLTIISGK